MRRKDKVKNSKTEHLRHSHTGQWVFKGMKSQYRVNGKRHRDIKTTKPPAISLAKERRDWRTSC
jgi:hypothetical protein